MDFDDKTQLVDAEKIAKATQGSSNLRAACFVVIAGRQVGRMYELQGREVLVGRAPEAVVCVEDDGVSRHHAKLSMQPDGTVLLTDLGSTNGTFCNGDRVTTCALNDGDKIQIGSTTILKFNFQDSLEQDFQRNQYESLTRDALTRCYNRRYLLDRLPRELAFSKRHHRLLSLAMVDIDFFKKVNDTHGHLAGDHVLREVAGFIQQAVRSDDVVIRYGGEEFAVIMREAPPDHAFIAAERMRRRVESAHISYEGKHIPVTVSIGVATWPDAQADDAETLIALADQYLYKAKRSGRNRTEGQAIV